MISKLIDRFLSVIYGALAFLFGSVAIVNLALYKSAPTGLQIIISGSFAILFGFLAAKRWRGKLGSNKLPANTDARQLASGEFYSRVVGTSHKNKDGKDRQDLIQASCRPGTLLQLVREPDNAFDPGAIAVYCANAQIGYLTSELADEYASQVDSGQIRLGARVTEVTGGTFDKPTRGVNIVVTLA